MLLGFVIISQGKGTTPSAVTLKTRLDNTVKSILCGLFCIVIGVDENYKVLFTSNFSSSEKQKNMQLMKFRTAAVLRKTEGQFILG